MKKVTRRGILAGGMTLTMSSFLTELAPADDKKPQDQCWKYVKLDPKKVGQQAYDCYKDGGCLYAAFKGGLLEFAQADPKSAAAVNAIPYAAFRAGRGGFARLKELCGAVAGSVMFMSCFVEDFKTLTALADKLGKYAAETELPVFIPAKDEHPNFLKVKAGGLTCRQMGKAWMSAASADQKKIVLERCKRHTASIIAKAVELLNEFYEKKA